MSSPDYSQAVADVLDGLDSPTPDEVYHATKDYDVNYLAAAAAAEAKAGGGGSQPFGIAPLLLTSAQIKDLVATPKQIAPAPGAGMAYCILSVYTQCFPGGTPYTCPNGAFLEIGPDLVVAGDLSPWETFSDPTSNEQVLNGGFAGHELAQWLPRITPGSPGAFALTAATAKNRPLVIGNPGGDGFDFADGDGTLLVTVFYAIFDVT